jgi:hypothetical protein
VIAALLVEIRPPYVECCAASGLLIEICQREVRERYPEVLPELLGCPPWRIRLRPRFPNLEP